MILDTFSSYVLEDCSNGAYRASGVHARLLDVNRDLIDLDRALRLTPAGYRLIYSTHTSAMGSDVRLPAVLPGSLTRAPRPVPFREDQILLYGAYADLGPGTYRAVFDGLALREGSLRIDVRSGKGKREHASGRVDAGRGTAQIDFTLGEPVKDLEVRLFSASPGRATFPTSLLIYRAGSASPARSATNPPRSGAAAIPSTSRR